MKDKPPTLSQGSCHAVSGTPMAGRCTGHAGDLVCDRPTSGWYRSCVHPMIMQQEGEREGGREGERKGGREERK